MNADLERIRALVESLARKHNFDEEQCRDIAQVIYDSTKVMREISHKEWEEFWKEKK